MISERKLSPFAVVSLLVVSSVIALSDCSSRLYPPLVVDGLEEEEEKLLPREAEDSSAPDTEDQHPHIEALERLQAEECGAHRPRNASSSRVKSRISGGFTAKQGEFPSYVQVQSSFRISPTTRHISSCGGVIMSDRLVVTAAHCVIDHKHHTRVGEHSIRAGNISRNSGSKMSVSSICLTKDGYFKGFDLAILTLKERLVFDENIQPACLPTADLDQNQQAHVIGLGLLRSAPQKEKPDLVQVLPVKRVKQCPRRRDWIFCFKASSKTYRGDACSGDSGGGIYVTQDGKQTAVGVVSGGPLACEPGLASTSFGTNLFSARARIIKMLKDCAKIAPKKS